MTDDRLVRLNQVTERQRSFLWPDRIVLDGLTVLDGDPGNGKSGITYDIAREALGRYPSPPTMWRWCGKGVTGIRLPAVMLSGRWMTSRRCWLAWLQARTAVKLGRDPVEDASDAELRDVGLR